MSPIRLQSWMCEGFKRDRDEFSRLKFCRTLQSCKPFRDLLATRLRLMSCPTGRRYLTVQQISMADEKLHHLHKFDFCLVVELQNRYCFFSFVFVKHFTLASLLSSAGVFWIDSWLFCLQQVLKCADVWSPRSTMSCMPFTSFKFVGKHGHRRIAYRHVRCYLYAVIKVWPKITNLLELVCKQRQKSVSCSSDGFGLGDSVVV